MEFSQMWPVLNTFSMLLVNNNRSKAYLQNLIKNGHRPDRVVVLNTQGIVLPEHTENDRTMSSQTTQKLIRHCPEAGISFDEKEHISRTLEEQHITHVIIDTIDVNSPEVIRAVAARPGSYIVYSGPGGVILRKEILAQDKYFLHVHPGWLPSYRGSTVMYYAILAGDTPACSVIVLSEEIDNGPVFYRRIFNAGPNTDMDYLFDPSMRTAALVDFFNQNREKSPVPIQLANEESDNRLFYIIHPVLKHLSILSLKNKSC